MSKDCCDSDLKFNPRQLAKVKYVLWAVFAINLGMFFLEFGSGLWARSSTLVADSLDMLADAFVYGLSLYVLKGNNTVKAKASLVKGVLMFVLGIYVVGESMFKIAHPVLPTGQTITTIGILALIANGVSLSLLWKHKKDDLNMKSAWICSRNDTTSNILVILAGFLVLYFESMWPDIIVGFGMSMIVIHSSLLIVKESLYQIKLKQ